MNNLLLELAKQAGLKFPSESAISPQEQKFAELIIFECADLFPMVFTDEQYQRRIDKTIKKHFGVE